MALFASSCGGGSESKAPAPQASQANSEADPVVEALSPAKPTGKEQVLEVVVSHPGGSDKIHAVQVMIAPSLGASKSCWIEYAPMHHATHMMVSGKWVPVAQVASSPSQCFVDGLKVKADAQGNSLKLALPVRLSADLKEPQQVFAIASTPTKHSGWKTLGVWNPAAPASGR